MSESSERIPGAVTPEEYTRIQKKRKVGILRRIAAVLGFATAAVAGGAVAVQKTDEPQPGEVLAGEAAARYKASRAPVVNIPQTTPFWEKPAVTPGPGVTPSTIDERAAKEIERQTSQNNPK